MEDKMYHAFDSIKASEKMKASARNAVRREEEKREKKFSHAGKIAAACAAFCVVLALGWRGVAVYPMSYVSIDVNPSIELSLNYWNRVIRATAYNNEGQAVLDSVPVKGCSFRDAVEKILECDAMVPYLGADADLTFTVATDDSGREEELYGAISGWESCHGRQATRCSAGVDSLAKAHENGMSLGEYAAYLKLYGYDSTVSVEECRDMTMSEIQGRICEHEESGTHGAEHGTEGGQETEHGTGGNQGTGTGHGGNGNQGTGTGHGSGGSIGEEHGTGGNHGHRD